PVTGFMAAGVRVAATIAFVRIVVLLIAPFAPQASAIFWWGAVLSMCLGNFAAIVQNNVKRMLAYSSIAHAGYLLIGFAGLSNVNLPGAEAVVYYLLTYALASLAIFALVGQVEAMGEANLTFNSYRGLGLRHPFVGVLAAALLLSLAGIPPLGGFWAKYAIFTTAIKNHYIGLALIGVLNSLVSVYYYFRLMASIYMRDPEQEPAVRYAKAPLATVAVALCVFLLIWFGVGPTSIGGLLPSANQVWEVIERSVSGLSGL
ncbi:MAG: proton-conducting transporter membrane subunit, partial [Chitinivibrionales bacterium]|nr:proton-conducting transporter membrane subunit [Chitinivibrionales bacterium]